MTNALKMAAPNQCQSIVRQIVTSVRYNTARKGYLQKSLGLLCTTVKTDGFDTGLIVVREIAKCSSSVWERGWCAAVESSLYDMVGYAVWHEQEEIVREWYGICVSLLSHQNQQAIIRWAERTMRKVLLDSFMNTLSWVFPFSTRLSSGVKEKLRGIVMPFVNVCVNKGQWELVGEAVITYQLQASFIDLALDHLCDPTDPMMGQHNKALIMKLLKARIRYPLPESRLSVLLAADPSLLLSGPLRSHVTRRAPHLLLPHETRRS